MILRFLSSGLVFIGLALAVTGEAGAEFLPRGADAGEGNAKAALLFGPRMHGDRFGAVLRTAWAAYERSDLGAAEKAFREVTGAAHPPTPDLLQALFGLGWCREYHRPLPDPKGATLFFGRIVTEHPASRLAPWALIELGNIHYKKGRPHQTAARKCYREVLERYPQSPAAHEAALRLADALFFEMVKPDMEAAAALLKEHLRKYPQNPLATIMEYRLDYFYGDIMEDYAAALPHAIAVANQKLNDPFRWSRQYWHVAEILRLRLGRPDEAAYWYEKILQDCPDSLEALEARQILEKMGRKVPSVRKAR